MKKVEFIYFDLGGVVVDHISALKTIAEKLVVKEDQVISFFKKQANSLDRGSLSWDNFEDLLYKELKPAVKPEKRLHKLFIDNCKRIKETHHLIYNLDKKFKIGILSNITRDTFKLIKSKKLIPAIKYKAVVISSELKTIKPEKKIFDAALMRAATDVTKLLLIDDRLDNIKAAKSFNWKAILFDTNKPKKSINKIKVFLGEKV